LELAGGPSGVSLVDKTFGKPVVRVDVEALARAFVNIVRNAFDAMPDGGTLFVSSKQIGVNVEISFADTGVGMSEDVLDRIWTPFFTTKAKGMGLGLSICRRIVEAHNGKVCVRSVEGKGTTFAVLLPVKSEFLGGD
jgi:signal transduction histidine kinase